MNADHVYAIAMKDMKEAFSSISIYGPMLGIPLFFAVVLPVFTVYISSYGGAAIAARLFGTAVAVPAGIGKNLLFIKFFAINILGPIFLTMPIITASVIAADSFSGEKERKTAESLFVTPATNIELLMGKILASLIPAFLLTVVVFVLYAGITNYFTIAKFGAALFPNTSWYMMLVNAPFLALTTIGTVVLVSARVRGVKESQQISALLVLPILIIPFVSVFTVTSLSFMFLLYMLIFLLATSALVLYLSIRFFDRERFI